MGDFATCRDASCGTRVKGRAATCPTCAGAMRNDGASKARGGLLLGLGLFLILFMGWISASLMPAAMPAGLSPGDGPTFTGTAEQGRTIVWIASDDNLIPLQRTLLMKFGWAG